MNEGINQISCPIQRMVEQNLKPCSKQISITSSITAVHFFYTNNFTVPRGSFLRKSFTNMVANINIDALKILGKIRLKTGKKLRTASINSKFTGFYTKKMCI